MRLAEAWHGTEPQKGQSGDGNVLGDARGSGHHAMGTSRSKEKDGSLVIGTELHTLTNYLPSVVIILDEIAVDQAPGPVNALPAVVRVEVDDGPVANVDASVLHAVLEMSGLVEGDRGVVCAESVELDDGVTIAIHRDVLVVVSTAHEVGEDEVGFLALVGLVEDDGRFGVGGSPSLDLVEGRVGAGMAVARVYVEVADHHGA